MARGVAAAQLDAFVDRGGGTPDEQPDRRRYRAPVTRERAWTSGALACAVAAAIVGLLTHELWRDEWQAWLIADGSESLGDLFANLRHEGHPPLWHVILFGLSRLGGSELMRVFHAGVGVATIALVVTLGPLRGWQKPAFALGYFTAYEYMVISRPYGLAALLTFGYVAVTWRGGRSLPVRAALLLLLAMTSIYGALVVVALVAATVLRPEAEAWTRRATVAAVGLGGAVLSVLVARPARGTDLRTGGAGLVDPLLEVSVSRASHVARTNWATLVPVPELTSDGWWGTELLDLPGSVGDAVLTGATFVAITILLRRSRPALACWLTGAAGLLAFEYVIFPGSQRHAGHLLMVALAALWIANGPGAGAARHAVSAFLALHAVAGVTALALEVAGPFSAGEAVARSLVASEVVAVDPDFLGTTVAGELDRPVFMPASGTSATFVRWNGARRCIGDARATCRPAEEVGASATRAGADVLVVPHGAPMEAATGWRLWRSFPDAAADETFDVYRPAPGG